MKKPSTNEGYRQTSAFIKTEYLDEMARRGPTVKKNKKEMINEALQAYLGIPIVIQPRKEE